MRQFFAMFRDRTVLHTSLEGQWFAGDQNNISAFIPPLHLIVVIVRLQVPGLPLRTGRVVQTGRLVCRTTDISRANNAVSVCDGEVEQTPGVHVFRVDSALWDGINELIDDGYRLQHRLSQNGWPETMLGLRARIMSHTLKCVQEESERPLAVGTTHNAQIPLIGQPLA